METRIIFGIGKKYYLSLHKWEFINNYIPLLCQIQLKLDYVAILCFAKPRTTGNLTQRPAKPNCHEQLPTTSFGADGSNRTHHTTIAKCNLVTSLLSFKYYMFDTQLFKTQDVTAFSGAL